MGRHLTAGGNAVHADFFLFLQVDKNGTNENKVLMKSVPGRNSLVERQKKKIQNKQQITKELLDACI